MNNKELMKKVIELDTQPLYTREQSQRVMIQISIIRKAFGVKNSETDAKVLDYERERILSNQEIEKEFKQYVGYWEWAIKPNNQDKARTFENQVYDFIEGVRFFDENLAESFKESFAILFKNRLKL
ncbi:hypothetical protein [Oceanobacillus profundus]|uniref:Uncharacterized protein n=1 Tax=Oceanobacillus profundus TaxID=372463 RepID=A0A417YGJ9_9BACI|nr:hypothetical protein [Oceanobacillus profundus]MBR2246133.1 hypothetical protein [Bacilli bacterium]MBR3119803.1 hypothetical protein [Oceanobacillus sp.]RHW31950.1 hypothetical protein D1B32_11975 [Oceanobacillus profundus]